MIVSAMKHPQTKVYPSRLFLLPIRITSNNNKTTRRIFISYIFFHSSICASCRCCAYNTKIFIHGLRNDWPEKCWYFVIHSVSDVPVFTIFIRNILNVMHTHLWADCWIYQYDFAIIMKWTFKEDWRNVSTNTYSGLDTNILACV